MKYESLVNGVVAGVGNIENIKFATHCATRLRLQVHDPSKMNLAAIKTVKGVYGVRDVGDGEVQIIVGTDIENIFQDFVAVTGWSGPTDDGVSASEAVAKADAVAQSVSVTDRLRGIGRWIMDYLGGTVAPVIPIYMCCGMIMAFLTVCTSFLGLDANSGVVTIFNAVSNAGFYFMPIVLGWAAADKLGIRPAYGSMLAMALIYITQNIIGPVDFFGISVFQVAYNGQFLPIILGVAFMKPVFEFFKNHIPANVQYFLLPLCTMIVTVPVVLIVLGPLGYVAGMGFSTFMQWMVAHAKFLASAVWGAFCPFGIISGMDKAVYSINMGVFDPSSAMYVGYDNVFCPGGLAGNSAIGGAALAVFFMLRKTSRSDTKQLAMSSGITAILGITEPALYGILLEFGRPFVGAMGGAAMGAMFGALFDLKQYSWAGPGLMTSPLYISPDGDMANFFVCLATIAVSALAGFACTLLVSRKAVMGQQASSEMAAEDVDAVNDSAVVPMATGATTVSSPLSGELKPMEAVSDPVFAAGTLGHGVAIVPADGLVVAPFGGTVTAVFPTNHAIGVTSDDGVECLVHIGIDTVELNGKHFRRYVEQGQRVRRGDRLVGFDVAAIKQEGYSIESPVIVSNSASFAEVSPVATTGSVTFGDDLLKVVR